MTQKTAHSNRATRDHKTKKDTAKKYQFPETITMPASVKTLNVADIIGYTHASQATVLRWFNFKGLKRLHSVRGFHTSREFFKKFLKKNGCLVLEKAIEKQA